MAYVNNNCHRNGGHRDSCFKRLKLVNAIPGAWLARFPHGGHAFIAQFPPALAGLINSFLALSTAHNAE